MNDEEAISRCQNGDSDAFRHLVERYKDVLYGTAYLMTGDRAAAEDHVQEALLSAWKGMRAFDNSRPLKPWLVRILVNKVVSYQRRGSVAAMPLYEASLGNTDAGTAEPAEELAEDVARRDEVRQALVTLSPEHRQIVMLRYFTELSVPEISAVLGCRQGTIKSRLHRALAQLRRVMEKS